MSYKFLVTKEGQHALASGLTTDDCYFDSDYPLLKIHAYGTFLTGITGETTINHSLGYIPYAMVFSQFVDWNYGTEVTEISTEYYQHDWFHSGASDQWWGYTKIYNDKLDIYVGQTWASPRPGQLYGFYYIFKEEVAVAS